MKFSGALGRPARPHQAVAEDVLLGDDARPPRSRSRIRARAPPATPPAAAAPVRPASSRTFTRLKILWSASTWLMRSRAPSLHSAMVTRLPACCSASTCWRTASNTLPSGCMRSGAKFRPGTGVGFDRSFGALRDREGRHAHQLGARRDVHATRCRPGRAGRAAADGRAARRPAIVERLPARVVIVGDLGEPLLGGVLRQRLERDHAARHIVEQRVEARYETAAANAPCRDSGGLRSPPGRTGPRSTAPRRPRRSRDESGGWFRW